MDHDIYIYDYDDDDGSTFSGRTVAICRPPGGSDLSA